MNQCVNLSQDRVLLQSYIEVLSYVTVLYERPNALFLWANVSLVLLYLGYSVFFQKFSQRPWIFSINLCIISPLKIEFMPNGI